MKNCKHENRYSEKIERPIVSRIRMVKVKKYIWWGEEREEPLGNPYIPLKEVIVTYCADCGEELKEVETK